MNQVEVMMTDIFSLVDIGVAFCAFVLKGSLKKGQKLVIGNKEYEILRIEGQHSKEIEELTPETSRKLKYSPGIILKNALKEDIIRTGIERKVKITLEVKD